MDPVAEQAAGFNLSSPLITFDLIARQGQNSHLACVLPDQTRVFLALMETTDGGKTVQAIGMVLQWMVWFFCSAKSRGLVPLAWRSGSPSGPEELKE
jgi:hypothetical protein